LVTVFSLATGLNINKSFEDVHQVITSLESPLEFLCFYATEQTPKERL